MKRRKSIRKIPDGVLNRIALSRCKTLRVGQVYRANSPEFQVIQAKFQLRLEDGIITCENPLPPASNGPWSRKNASGWVEVRRDLGLEPFSYTISSPNWGDPSKGYHDHVMTGKRYPRTHHGAKLIAFAFRYVEEEGEGFVECYLDKEVQLEDADFETNLFFQLNLYCENIGTIDVLVEGEAYRPPIGRVDWRIFPELSIEQAQEYLTQAIRGSARRQQIQERVLERLHFFKSLNPSKIIIGGDAFTRYIGAVYRDQVALFECVNYGNAIYILGEDWERLTQLSRTELLTTPGFSYHRIVHKGDWKKKAEKELLRRIREIEDGGGDEPPAMQPVVI